MVKNAISQKNIIYIFKAVILVATFCIIDAWLRVMTRWIGQYSIFKLPPNLFTLCWALILACIILLIPKLWIRRVAYGILYFLLVSYVVVQYGYWLIFRKFLYFSDFLLAGEGLGFAGYVKDIITPTIVIQVAALILSGILGILLMPNVTGKRWKIMRVNLAVAVIAVIGVMLIPKLYEGDASGESWDSFQSPAYEYEKFINSEFDMELMGVYQYIMRDAWNNLKPRKTVSQETIKNINSYFANRDVNDTNDMTGIFSEKNVIIVMMESMDDWLITEEDTPAIYKMMKEGISFENLYTPDYSSGYTFNTEFAFNVSVYPYSNGNVAYSLTANTFSQSIANRFAKAGYSVNSFHEGTANFYNRGEMHQALGYEKYHSYKEYCNDDLSVKNDSILWENDELYSNLTEKKPFMSFVITFSAHLPYSIEGDDAALAQYALYKYPQYAEGEVTEEDVIRAKAHLTDDMFAGLLNRLKEDEILEDTVIIGFADHYAYGLTDDVLLQKLSEDAGNSILENTPAFIYCAGYTQSMVVDKVMQTTDLAPTIENLFGLDMAKNIMGHDVFDKNYKGYAIFPNNTWITNSAYVKNGNVIWNNGMSNQEIIDMNVFVQETYNVNDAILESNYYSFCDN